MPRPPSKTTDINTARSALKRALKAAVLLLDSPEPELRLRAVHATAQAAAALGRLAELGDLEARLSALENRAQVLGATRVRRMTL